MEACKNCLLEFLSLPLVPFFREVVFKESASVLEAEPTENGLTQRRDASGFISLKYMLREGGHFRLGYRESSYWYREMEVVVLSVHKERM